MNSGRRKNQSSDIFEVLPQAIEKFRKNIIDPFFKTSGADEEDETSPLRAEIFTDEQLAQHARQLSARHATVSISPSEELLKRLDENEQILLEVHSVLTEMVKKNNRIVPAAEWLLDNFYLIEEQIYTAKKHLPKGYSKGLPKLEKGASAGLPRVYDLVVEIISHSDGHVNLETLINFVNAYQETTSLKLGELWAIPIMLRLALLENLRRLSIQISVDISNKTLADTWADQLIEISEKDPKNLVLVIADMARSKPPITSSFVAELTRRIQEQGSSLALATSWLEQTLLEHGFTSAELIQSENQKQAADQVSISNSISSLRFLGVTDWREFVERTSIVEQTLSLDKSGIYPLMDFHTRDNYRHMVEKIAKYSPISEKDVAEIALQLAADNVHHNGDSRTTHVGYYLTGPGLKYTEQKAGMKKKLPDLLRQFVNKVPLLMFTIAILLITSLISWFLLMRAYPEGGTWTVIGMCILIVTASSQFAVSFINWLVTLLAKPTLLPRMDFSKGIPENCRTIVVIPTLLQSESGIDDLTENLEVRFLANRNIHLQFALLTDFVDADHEHLPEDDLLLETAKQRIAALNKKYERSDTDSFILLHRDRKWNHRERKWMGYERKRGKLGDLNALIQGESDHKFSFVSIEPNKLCGIKYVITLDSDTQLPRDAAWMMIATMAHPLNQPVYDEKKQRVTEGYTILQPRVSNSLPMNGSSLYMKIHGNEPGTDPYTRATSDVYQDLFKQGSFIGKGIYDVALFEKTLKNRLPENRILSHDLLEGAYTRSGLITDVQLYEEYPSSYITDMGRRHRWIRGDWQIGNWVLPFVPGMNNKWKRNPIDGLNRWKISDNLRRSLTPIALTLVLLYGWLFSSVPFLWTIFVGAIIIGPSIIGFIVQLLRRPSDSLFVQHFIYTLRSASETFYRYAVDFICLPYEAYLNTDAILRTLWRVIFYKRNLLQWNPYSNKKKKPLTVPRVYRQMWFAPFLAYSVFVYLTIYDPITMAKIFPFLAAWFLSPMLVWYISRSHVIRKSEFSEKQIILLRQMSRKIWLFFETFVGKEDNWLPPDNYQEQPVERIAHRTSPTNIGLALLGNLSAFDFGYITMGKLVELTDNTLSTMERMEKYRGHFYNWYDTITLNPLSPRYISTVDSGNLVGSLVTLKQGLQRLCDQSILDHSHFEGLLDECRMLNQSHFKGLEEYIEELKSTYPAFVAEPIKNNNFITEQKRKFEEIVSQSPEMPGHENQPWILKIVSHFEQIQIEIGRLTGWIILPEAPEVYQQIISPFNKIPALKDLEGLAGTAIEQIDLVVETGDSLDHKTWLSNFRKCMAETIRHAKERLALLDQLSERCQALSNVDYDFLYDRTQHLLTIGYNTEEHRKDNSYYDLLASEARLATYIAIAQGKLPQQSWFALGRQLTHIGTTPILLSWSGSMFEYLMPILVMPAYENTLLHQTCRAVVQKQIEYGRKMGVPWGISESGYNMVDGQMNYQYRAFGVPGLGFKRGLGEDLVISPYSTIMSLMVMPEESYENILTLKEKGFEGKYGFYEAIDYTHSRLLRKQEYVVVSSFMAHHQGMSFLSLNQILCKQAMQKRFESDVQVKSALLLLQERIPRVTTFYSPSVHLSDTSISVKDDAGMRVLDTVDTIAPEVQLLSNGRYHVMVSNAGGGYSRWKNLALTRWREDCTCDNWGTFCFIRDLDNDVMWSASFQPSMKDADNYQAVFSQGRAEFRRRDQLTETHTEIVVSPEDDIELRRVHLTNRSRKRRTIEITSYTEVVLTSAIADELHPAFSNLFVQTQINEQRNAILGTRRPRSVDEHNPWMFHLMKVHDAAIKEVTYETDRDRFIGRSRNIHDPQALDAENILSGSQGSVLDPIMSIRYRIVLEPYETVTIDMIFGVAESIETCNALIEKYQDRHLINRVLELAWTHSQVILRQINATEADAQLYSRLASSIIYSNASMRADASVIVKNQKGQQGLWAYSISGDLPIVLVQIEDVNNIALVRQMVQAHAYWRLKGLVVDLVIWNDDHGGYRQDLHNMIMTIIAPGLAGDVRDKPGGIFIRSSDQIPNEDRILFQSIAHIVLADKWGKLEEQVKSRLRFRTAAPYFEPVKTPTYEDILTPSKLPKLQFFNGLGGFSNDGKEYIIQTGPGKATPAPWINVIANSQFGSIITESGGSYTWMENAHEFRLSPWSNDPVSDLKGEAFFIRDEESGEYWSPTPLPRPGKNLYTTRHGFGYSVFEYMEQGLETEMTTYTDIQEPIKFIVLKIRNRSQRKRRISITGYVELVLGDLRSKTIRHIITEMDLKTGAMLASNIYHPEMGSRVAFFDVDDPNRSFTADRTEFIGRNGSINNPDAMQRKRLSGKLGAALDPCAAIQVAFDLAEDEEHQVVFRLGAGKNREHALSLIQQFEGSQPARKALEKVNQYWQKTLGAVQIETPDQATNILSNGWLNYQALACRFWGRSGFYQSGGAFGFRDQLQDVLSLMHTNPKIAREQLLICASRQFKEGDVQHWWHPPAGRGVRTTCSDDFLWLPYVASRYVMLTGDTGILEEVSNFIEGRLLNTGEESYYDLPIPSDKRASLYEHCVKAIERGLSFGVHGLPLMGSGDWNDGMDKVGQHGKGESVWLAFFLYDILNRFAEIAELKDDRSFADNCRAQAVQLQNNIRLNAWDGEWYRRAYFDDGTPLGSSVNDECRIDSIAQSWAVLSNAGDKDRIDKSLKSAEKYLIQPEGKFIQLFDPPFDKSTLNPGYIKGYVPGVRENGGQYTHAAIWLVMAFATVKNKPKTWELLQMINPINHGNDESSIKLYKTEPYVIAADIYGGEQHRGRGGWTWYTGSAGWFYQLILESFIGLQRKGNQLRFSPCFPADWKSVRIHYRFENTVYHIELRFDKKAKMNQDGIEQDDDTITLMDSGREHQVILYFGEKTETVSA